MDTTSDFLTQDHRACDALWVDVEAAAEGAGGAVLVRAFADFEAAMERHFDFEEGFLFPAFEAETGMTQGGPTFVMRHEHAQMRQLLRAMAADAAAGRAQAVLDRGDTLMILVGQHNLKEEHVLYPACDAHVAPLWPAMRARFPTLP